ncbi:hypothetical protein [Clostridium tarantellae]|uniref:hypothetical protein n=1 Tax=Clostridium tarantellae TaxID=39493 RepID=UPI0014786282|nr:hypothetical protein [Clostridium tarantellae]
MDNTNFKKIYINRLSKINHKLRKLMENKKWDEYCELLKEKERINNYLYNKEKNKRNN